MANRPGPLICTAPADGPKDILLASAAVMDKAATAKLTLSGDIQSSGALSWQSPRMLELSLPMAGRATAMRIAEDAVYVATPPEGLSRAGGKHWMKIDGKAAAAVGKQDESASMFMLVEVLNPVLELHAAVQDNAITTIGADKVNGVDTVHYSARVTADTLAAQMTFLSDDARKRALDWLRTSSPSGSIEFWIDAKNELVRLGVSDLTNTGSKASTLITLTDLGTAPAPTAPDLSDTYFAASSSDPAS